MVLQDLEELSRREDWDPLIGAEGQEVLRISGPDVVGLASNRALEDAVIWLVALDYGEVDVGSDALGQAPDFAHGLGRLGSGKGELLSKDTGDLIQDGGRNDQLDDSCSGEGEQRLRRTAKEERGDVDIRIENDPRHLHGLASVRLDDPLDVGVGPSPGAAGGALAPLTEPAPPSGGDIFAKGLPEKSAPTSPFLLREPLSILEEIGWQGNGNHPCGAHGMVSVVTL